MCLPGVPCKETHTQATAWCGRVASSFPRRLLTFPSSKECQVPIYCWVKREFFSPEMKCNSYLMSDFDPRTSCTKGDRSTTKLRCLFSRQPLFQLPAQFIAYIIMLCLAIFSRLQTYLGVDIFNLQHIGFVSICFNLSQHYSVYSIHIAFYFLL